MNPTQAQSTLKITRRHRRLRRSDAMRALVRETRLSPEMFMLPLFVCEGRGVRREISSMPGVFNLSVDEAVKEVEAARGDGIRSVLLFGLPDHKDAVGSASYDPNAPVRAALSHAAAGADLIAPSDMMDGRVGAIREALDERGFENTAVMAYAAKYWSAFYGPFREAADSAPKFGDRASYQMDPANVDEALREVAQDIEEGADIVMVKPALPYLDVLTRVKMEFGYPTAAYQVSGEYSMLKAAARNGWLDEKRAMLECLTAIRRAGADIIITYYAREAARAIA